MKSKSIIREIFSDSDSVLSSKRILAFLGFVLIGVSWYFNLFYHSVTDSKLLEIISDIIMVSLGITGVEKFTKVGSDYYKNKYTRKPTETTIEETTDEATEEPASNETDITDN